MDDDQKLIVCFIAFALIVVIQATCLLSPTIRDTVSFVGNYGVDSNGRVYISHNAELRVYQNNELVDTIRLDDSLSRVQDKVVLKGIAFAVTPEDTILVETGEYTCTLDLQGNLLRCVRVNDYSVEPLNISGKIVTKSGDVYQKKHVLGQTAIVENNSNVVYQISVLATVVKWCKILSILAFPLVVITIIKCYLREYII